MTKTKGLYSVPRGRIAYAAQDSLIIPGTVRDNILFGSPFFEEWYQRVIAACALTQDISTFSSGDATFLGGASRLSGGQSQRIVSSFMGNEAFKRIKSLIGIGQSCLRSSASDAIG